MPKLPAVTRKANGAAIRSLRMALGIPQNHLAVRVGVTAATMSQIEKGKQPGPDTIRRIADELGVPLDAISYPVPEAVPEDVAS
jgi:transcriptional regulator with XRE-family HTH domain